MSRKRTREEELAVLKRSPLFRNDPGRAYVLIETLRIINNNLPFRIGEYEESLIIRDLMLKEEARVALNAKVIRHSVVELYDATKRQVQAMLGENRIGSAKCFSIVADFWTASPMNTKFLGLRLYLVDSTFQFKSVLLGTRHFAPQYGERDGPDVKWMMKTGLKLSWEWCVPHFTHAATKAAFGIVGDTSASKNPAMTDMIKRIVKTVYQIQHVEVMGTLFNELCSVMTEEDVHARQLLNFRVHRFLGLTRNVLPPAPFPLAREKMELIQVLSLLEPISVINRIEQAESGNQCNVLLGLYKLRISLFDVTTPLKDCRSTKTEKRFFRPEELSNLASSTRALLHKAFHRVFFKRYTDREVMNTCSYAFEMQLLLHPNFKKPDGALKKVVIISNLQAGASQQVADRHFAKVRPAVFSDDLMDLFADTLDEVAPPLAETQTAMHEQRIDEELDRWLTTPTTLKVVRPGENESVLNFWKRQHEHGNFRLLPLVARVLFSMPSSSAQIELDFGTAGRMVTPQRGSLAPYNVDMATFLSCNRSYVDITQCPKLSTNTAAERLPSNVLVNMVQELDDEFGSMANLFSGARMDLGLSDNEDADVV
eukprot:jgi/Phyca11/107918/e_gw1.14.221.1